MVRGDRGTAWLHNAGGQGLRFRFKTHKLHALYTDNVGASKRPTGVVAAFFRRMATIAAAADERDLYALESLHFERLKGPRAGQHSIKLHGPYRLILTIEEDEQGKYLQIVEIVDYH